MRPNIWQWRQKWIFNLKFVLKGDQKEISAKERKRKKEFVGEEERQREEKRKCIDQRRKYQGVNEEGERGEKCIRERDEKKTNVLEPGWPIEIFLH